MARMKSDIFAALLVTAVGFFFLIQARMIESFQEALIGPRLVPMVLAALIIGLGVLQLVLAVMAGNNGAAEAPVFGAGESELPALSKPALNRMAAIIGLGFVYVWLFSATGYLISTAVVLAALLVVFGNRAIGRVVVLTIGGTAAYYLIFIKLMGIYDPPGWLIDLGRFGLE